MAAYTSMRFINKLYVKAIFSNDSSLNVVPQDLGDRMIKVETRDNAVERIRAATGTVGSANGYLGVTVTINVLKTSPVCKAFFDKIVRNAYIDGTCTIYNDVGESYQITDISLSPGTWPDFDGKAADLEFKVEGNLIINKEIWV